MTGEVGVGGASAIALSTRAVSFVFIGMARLRLLDSLTSFAQSNSAGVRFVGGHASVCTSHVVLLSSLVLTFFFRSSSISRTSLGNGIPLSFGHSHRRRHEFSSICTTVMVTGSHQQSGVAGG